MENFIELLPLHPPPKGETDFPQKTNSYIDFQKRVLKITLRRTYISPSEGDEGGDMYLTSSITLLILFQIHWKWMPLILLSDVCAGG